MHSFRRFVENVLSIFNDSLSSPHTPPSIGAVQSTNAGSTNNSTIINFQKNNNPIILQRIDEKTGRIIFSVKERERERERNGRGRNTLLAVRILGFTLGKESHAKINRGPGWNHEPVYFITLINVVASTTHTKREKEKETAFRTQMKSLVCVYVCVCVVRSRLKVARLEWERDKLRVNSNLDCEPRRNGRGDSSPFITRRATTGERIREPRPRSRIDFSWPTVNG